MNRISVKERLPEEWVSVLGFMHDSRPFLPARECYRIPGEEKFFFPALRGYMPITHWMPLPEPPKEET